MAGSGDRGEVLRQFMAVDRLPVHYGGTVTPAMWQERHLKQGP